MLAQLTFYGGAGSVTGSNFLLEADGTRALIDCGLTQGARFCHECNYDPFPYDPRSIEIVLPTHAHMDHIGRIPRLVREGYDKRIVSTPETKELAEILLRDSVGILAEEAKEAGRDPLYENRDVDKTLSLWDTVSYHDPFPVGPFSLSHLDAGHILGSAMLSFEKDGAAFVATGDLGNSPAPLLQDTESIRGARYLLMESVYGDRNHQDRDSRQQNLKQAILDIRSRGGTLLIPAFSVDRTQVLLYEINKLFESGDVAPMPVFLDSPLAIRATEIYRSHPERFKENVRREIAAGDDVFSFPGFAAADSVQESRAIADAPEPKIIIAGSGMSMGGRILFHERRVLEDPKSTLLLVGYQGIGTLGRAISEGKKTVRIGEETVHLRAEVRKLTGYSAHKQSDDLIDFVADAAETLREVYVAMGEPQSSQFLAQRINDFLGVSARVPNAGDTVEMDFS